jgi:undecaprenyl-diphosphatase
MHQIDQAILEYFASARVEWLSLLMLAVTYSGGYMVVSLVTCLSAISFYIHKRYRELVSLLISVGGSAISVFLLKNFFDKSRPAISALYEESGFSMPSGHSAMAMALYGFIFVSILRHENHPLKNKSLLLLGLLIALIGLSRLYLGVHYLSDVLAGFTVGLIWVWASRKVIKI